MGILHPCGGRLSLSTLLDAHPPTGTPPSAYRCCGALPRVSDVQQKYNKLVDSMPIHVKFARAAEMFR